jgi:acetyltransferase-like isoleucine patch superfamily enzyme
MRLIQRIQAKLARRSSERYIRWLRQQGVQIGDGCTFFSPASIVIDTTRPSLLTIGRHVQITRGCVILTHGYDWAVLRQVYEEVLASSGAVTIQDNVFIGVNSIVLKGVTIGSDTIIGAGSVVTRSIPSGSVAAGNPARVTCTLAQYYEKRKRDYIDEAKAYARSIEERFHRAPEPRDFWEEFPLFTKLSELGTTPIPVRKQLGSAYAHFQNTHVPPYDSFQSFLDDCRK